MTKLFSFLVMAALSAVALIVPGRAHAYWPVSSPWSSDGVVVVIGYSRVTRAQEVVFMNTRTWQCWNRDIGNGSGLYDNIRVYGSPKRDDFVFVTSGSTTMCGKTMYPIGPTGGRYIDIFAGGGDDFVSGGPVAGTLYGQDGDDLIVAGSYSPARVYGGDGNDWLFGSIQYPNNYLYGEDGNDYFCNMVVTSNKADASMLNNGGSGYDRSYGYARSVVSVAGSVSGNQCNEKLWTGIADYSSKVSHPYAP